MNPLRMFDEAIMAAADGLVLWLWNEFEVRRIWALRVPLAVVLAANASGGYWVSLAFATIAVSMEELANRFLPDKAHEALIAPARWTLPWSVLRPVMVAWCAFDAVAAAAAPDWWALAFNAALGSYLILSWSVVPTDPPQRRRSLVLAPQVSR